MSKFIEPAGDHLIVIDSDRSTTIDGITLPDNVKQQEMVFGAVIFVGPGCSAVPQPKDAVMYGPYAGKSLVLDGVEFRILREDQIEGYLRDEEPKETNHE